MQVIILRGLPGAGKSRYVASAVTHRDDTAIVSADDFYVVDGVYKYTGNDQAAHQSCWSRFKLALHLKHETVFVDNTNTEAHELAPYIMEAWAQGYGVKIVRIRTKLSTVLERNKTRGSKSVPEHVIGMMHQRLSTSVLPPYWPKEEVILGEPAPTELIPVTFPVDKDGGAK